MVHQIAPGNISTTILCADKEYDETFIIQMGMSAVLNEGEDSSLNLIEEGKLDKIHDLCSMPFEINFRIPVVKIATGDMVAAILTAEGQVFTWGQNNCGALGIDEELVII